MLKKIIFLVFGVVFVLISSAGAAETSGSVAVTQGNGIVLSDGALLVDGRSTETLAVVQIDSVDLSVWLANDNNDCNCFLEIDFAAGYSFDIATGFNARVGLASWQYIEDGGSNLVFVGSLNYTGCPAVDLGFELTQILDDSGTQFKGSVSRTVSLWEDEKDASFTVTPVLEVSFLNNYFGVSDSPGNIMLGGVFSLAKGNFGVDLSVKSHNSDHYGSNLVTGVSAVWTL